MTIRRLLPVFASALLLIALAASPAVADTMYNIEVPNTALSSYPTPYGTVDVSLNTAGTIATITFTNNVINGYTYLFGGKNAVAVNVNGTFSLVSNSISFTGGCTGTGCAAGGTGFSSGSGNISGFGNFNFTLKDNDGVSDAVSQVSFQLSGNWSSSASVLSLNSLNNLVGAHIFVTGSTALCGSSGVCTTGFATNTGGNFTPEPNTAALLGLALFGLGFVFWRRGMFTAGRA